MQEDLYETALRRLRRSDDGESESGGSKLASYANAIDAGQRRAAIELEGIMFAMQQLGCNLTPKRFRGFNWLPKSRATRARQTVHKRISIAKRDLNGWGLLQVEALQAAEVGLAKIYANLDGEFPDILAALDQLCDLEERLDCALSAARP